MVPLDTNPWIGVGLLGGVLGLFGAAVFIAISSLLQRSVEERRSRYVVARSNQSNDRVLQELLLRAEPQVSTDRDSVMERARLAFWKSRGILAGSYWTPRSHEVRPKLPN
jgi:hypothetical protein